MLKVKKQKCDQCLFSDNKIVSSERKRQIIAGCKRKDSHFQCHKATIEGEDHCCRGFYDSQTSSMIRIAQRLKAIVFVD